MLVVPVSGDLRFFVLVSRSGEGPVRTLGFSSARRGPKAQPGFPSPPQAALLLGSRGLSSFVLCCVVLCDHVVLLGCIGLLGCQDTLEHAADCICDGDESPLARPFAWRLWLAPLVLRCAMWLMRDEPLGIVIEPVPEVGTVHMRYRGELPHTGATFEQTDSEPCQFDELCAVGVRTDIANGRQDGRGSRSADPG